MSICRVWISLSLIAVTSAVAYAAQADRVLSPVTGVGSMTLPGTVHRAAQARFDQGPADPALRFGSVMLLTNPTLAQQRALNQLLAEQQDPSSPNYHRWLTPEQWADRFGLSQNDIQKITTWLKSQGFTVEYVARGRNWVSFSGTAIQIESAFGTAIHSFNVNGEMHVANAIPVKIPAGLSGIVTGIHGLNDFYLKPRARIRPNYFDSASGSQFVSPTDIATIYDITPLYTAGNDGTGQKVAIAGQTDIYLADIADFRSDFGLSAISCTANTSGVITACNDPHFKYVVPSGAGTDPQSPLSGDLGEADLDIEMSSAVARGAQIIYVNAPANASGVGAGVWGAWYAAVDGNIAPVISLSYGLCEFGDNDVLDSNGNDLADETELKKANSQGITFVNSSGDSGAAECDPTQSGWTPPDPNGSSATQGIAISYPASSPEVTGVGGTATPLADFGSPFWQTSNTNNGSATEYVPEQAWNDDNEIAQFCAQSSQSANKFCLQGGATKVTGWVAITSAKIAQQDLALLGDGISSTGGGASNCAKQTADNSACVSGFAKPSWQTVTVSGQSSVRFSPDISFLASPNFPGYIFCTQLSELGVNTGTPTSSCASGIASALSNNSVIGGTSASAPLFAGIVALLNQYLNGALGNVNPKLYALATTPANGAFHTVISGDNLVYCTPNDPGNPQPSTLWCPASGVLGFDVSNADTVTGFNLVTGLGSADVGNLATAWAASRTPSSVSLSAPANAFQGQSVTLTATVTPSTATGNVTFMNGSATLGSAALSAGTASLSTSSLPVAANSITASYAGSPTVGKSASTASTVTVTVPFTISPAATSANISQGSNYDLTVNVTELANPPVTITFTCNDPAEASTCTPPPNTNATGQVTFHITTSLPTAKLQPPIRHEQRIFFAALLPGLLGVFFTVGAGKRRITHLLGLLLVLGVSTLWMASCGGNGGGGTTGNPGTPKGAYTITVSGSSGGSTSNSTFVLNVQ